MPFSMMPSGAWLSGVPADGAGLQPIRRRGLSADLQPIRFVGESADLQPIRHGGQSADLQPIRFIGQSADLQPIRRAGQSSDLQPIRGASQPYIDPRTNSPWPWEGVDPTWTYDGVDELLAQAMRRTRAKIVRPADPKLPRTSSSVTGSPNDLWRWQSQFRITTVVTELITSFCVEDRALYLVTQEISNKKVLLDTELMFSIPPSPMNNPKTGPKYEGIQIDKVIRAAIEREDRLPEIISQAEDLTPFFEAICGFRFAQAPAATELIAVAHDWALHLIMGLKNQVAARRPWERSELVIPVIPTPGHGSLPSGHATIAAMTSELLLALLYKKNPKHMRAVQLDRLARRIAFNRVVAGVHFPIDSWVGYQLGTQLARILIAAADNTDKQEWPEPIHDPFTAIELTEVVDTRLEYKPQMRNTHVYAPLLSELWRVAVDELNRLAH